MAASQGAFMSRSARHTARMPVHNSSTLLRAARLVVAPRRMPVVARVSDVLR